MKRQDLQYISETEENRQNETILSLLIWISWAAYLVVIITSLLWGDLVSVFATSVSAIIVIVPFLLLKRGHLIASGLFLVLIVLTNVTLLATIGQGIHDVAIMAYPTIIIFGCMALNRIYFRICVVLTLASMAWLVFGEANGLFVSQTYKTPNWIDFMVIAAILLAAVLATNALVTNMRRNLALARQEIEQRKRVEEQLRYQSTHDVMTGIYNRNFFETELTRLDRGREFPISIIIADIDGLKVINDSLGHAMGDKQLQNAANVLRSAFRAGDILARIGGDEFAALLPATDSASLEQIVSRIRARLTEYNTNNSESPVHLSLGAATAEKSNLTGTFTLADQRMYTNKALRKSLPNLASAA
jgi:diguanylate cyclase (GGDEF)-like protein